MEQYLAGPAPESVGNFTQQNTVDLVLEVITQVLIRGKFFALFSFLYSGSVFAFKWTAPKPERDTISACALHGD